MDENAPISYHHFGCDEWGLVLHHGAVDCEHRTKYKWGDGMALFLSLLTATASPSSSSSSGSFDEPTSGGGTSFTMPDWTTILGPLPRILKEAGEKMDRVSDTVGDVMSGKFLKDSIDNLVILWSDEAAEPLMSVFQKVYLFTPRIAELNFVQTLWSIITLLCVIALFVGSGILANQVMRGKKEMGALLKGFIVSLVTSILSLTILNMINVIANWMTQVAVEGIIGTEGIDYTSLTGFEILKALVVGSDVLTDPSYAGQTLAETLVASGGIFALMLHMWTAIPTLYMIAIIKILTLMGMAIGVGFWIAYVAFTGKLEVLVGYFNIYVRTLLVGLGTTVHWALFVRAQTDYGNGEGIWAETGVNPVVAVPISVCILVVVFFFVWLRPLWRAVRDPLTLNGGQMVESAGKWSERASTALHAVGRRLGSEGLQKSGLNIAAAAKKMRSAGQRMQSARGQLGKRILSKATGGVSEALQGVHYEAPKEWAKQSGDVITIEQAPVSYSGAQVVADPHEMTHALKTSGFSASTMVAIPAAERADVTKMLAMPDFKQKYGASITYKASTGDLLLSGAQGTAALKELREAQFTVTQAQSGYAKDQVFVGQDGQIQAVGRGAAVDQVMKSVKDQLPTYKKANLSPTDAVAAHRELTGNASKYPWVNKLKLQKDGLWVPEDLMAQVTPILEGMQQQSVTKVRLELPKGSRYLTRMLEDLKQSGQNDELLGAIEADPKKNALYIRQEKLASFQAVHDNYRVGRTPYWRTSMGKVKVILDGQPVDYGNPPLKGLDMGSFEELQKDMLLKHSKA